MDARTRFTQLLRGRRAHFLGRTALMLGLLAFAAACSRPVGLAPHPSYTPEQVVRIQVESLAGPGGSEEGIARVFQFASPSNKAATGPFERFSRLVRAPEYAPMLRHTHAEYGPVLVEGSLAFQAVLITAWEGSRHLYLFQLSRQKTGSMKGCWMTDTVLPIRSERVPSFEV